jgi:hypothetical protein
MDTQGLCRDDCNDNTIMMLMLILMMLMMLTLREGHGIRDLLHVPVDKYFFGYLITTFVSMLLLNRYIVDARMQRSDRPQLKDTVQQ